MSDITFWVEDGEPARRQMLSIFCRNNLLVATRLVMPIFRGCGIEHKFLF